MRTIPPPLALLFTIVCLVGCSAEKTRMPTAAVDPLSSRQVIDDGSLAPDDPGASAGDFYPLEIGNEWTFSRHLKAVREQSGEPPELIDEFNTTVQTDLTCAEVRGDHTYVVEHSAEDYNGQIFEQWIRMRQDPSGLYEVDAIFGPPACETRPQILARGTSRISQDPGDLISERLAQTASTPGELTALVSAWDAGRNRLEALHGAIGSGVVIFGRGGGPAEGELVRLKYPLHPGQSWAIREDPLFSSEDEAVDVLHTDAGAFNAHRVRIDSELFGPNDRVYLFVGRSGLVGIQVHLESVGTDPEGNIVKLVIDDVLTLVGIDLVGPGAN